ncbi:MAG TPA: nucleotidyltransferase family protein [Thermoanaerobaculia bacterium]|nr:nucleotidyltransferase family protein [Thermoanaerobaculia bacterium]
MPLEPFSTEEVGTLLGDPDVALLSEACVRSIRDGRLSPLVEALSATAGRAPSESLLRKAAFAAAIQGLSPRLARLPGLDALPGALAERFALEAERCAGRGRRIVERLREVLSLLASAGLEAIPLKGAALLLRGEAAAGLRPMGDLDLLLVDPARVSEAAAVLTRATSYRPLLDTPRHLVLAEESEAVPSPAGEHPDNPLRIELHRSFRLPVLGVVLDATKDLVKNAGTTSDGFRVPSDAAMLRHLWHHAAEDYASKGLRGIQALDFLDRAGRLGPLSAMLHEDDVPAVATLLYAADGLERLFPGTFDAASLERLAAGVPTAPRERASVLSVLRHTRPSRGFTRTGLSLSHGRPAQVRFLFRNAFPTLGEVKANVAPGAEGLALRVAWLRVLARRAASLIR